MREPPFLASECAAENPAVFDANTGQWFTHGELSDCLNAFAERLRFPQKALGFHFPLNEAESLIGYLAALQAGHAIAMLNPGLDEELRKRLVERFQPDFILTAHADSSQSAWLESGGYRRAETPQNGPRLFFSSTPNRNAVHPDLALLISTSGSTGSPKLVRLTRSNLETNARQVNGVLRATERDRSMVTAPIFNAYGLSVIHTMLLAGGGLALTGTRIVSGEFWDTVRQAECNCIGGTPYFYQALDRLDLESLNVPRLTKFLQVGGRLAGHLARKFHALAQSRGGELHLMYGQAEATRISALPPELLPEACASVGFALPGGRLWVERDGRECEPMGEGELVYEGPNVMMGYATCTEDLAKGDELGGRVATGDLGYRDAQGLFYITGRKSRFVKMNGWRVSLDDVEELLSVDCPVAATGEQDRVVIYSEQPEGALDEAVMQLAERLNLHPSGFEIRSIERIPRLFNGKVDYRALAGAATGTAIAGLSR